MANQKIRQQFIEGVHTVFHTLFNYGIEGEDGISLFRLCREDLNVYGEQLFRKYKEPITLIAKVSETPVDGVEDIESQKRSAVFSVPYKSLLDNNITMNKDEIKELRGAMLMFNDVYYSVDKIQGKAFVENTYMIWEFYCTEDPSVTTLEIEIPTDEEVPDNSSIEGDLDG